VAWLVPHKTMLGVACMWPRNHTRTETFACETWDTCCTFRSKLCPNNHIILSTMTKMLHCDDSAQGPCSSLPGQLFALRLASRSIGEEGGGKRGTLSAHSGQWKMTVAYPRWPKSWPATALAPRFMIEGPVVHKEKKM
jgi:hypothetical protein